MAGEDKGLKYLGAIIGIAVPLVTAGITYGVMSARVDEAEQRHKEVKEQLEAISGRVSKLRDAVDSRFDSSDSAMDTLNLAVQRLVVLDEVRTEGRAVAGGYGSAGGATKATAVIRHARDTMTEALDSYTHRRAAIEADNQLSDL